MSFLAPNDDFVLRIVQQFLSERGYEDSLRTLQVESGQTYETDQLEMGGTLCSMLNELYELKLSQSHVAAFSQQRAEEELLTFGDGRFPSVEEQALPNYHHANVICVEHSPDGKQVATGSTDKTIKIMQLDTQECVEIEMLGSPLLSLAWYPKLQNLIVCTSMDGKASLVDIAKRSILCTVHDHTKYVTRAKWSDDGSRLVTVGFDKNLCIYALNDEGNSLDIVKKMQLPSIAEGICFIPNSHILVMGLRDDNYLHYFDVDSFEDKKVNMNQLGDDHVSFNAMDIAISPNKKFVLVATDKSRLIIFPLEGSNHLRSLYGAVNDDLCQCRCAWHPSGHYIYSTSQDNSVYIWEVATQKVLKKLEGHKATVRDLSLSPNGTQLITGSFDKSLKIWKVET